MKIQKLTIHNFRSIKHQEILLGNYSVLLGENNAGKTNIMRALRIFYEDGVKFHEKEDFPKFATEDKESWIEIEFLTTDQEQVDLKDEYKRDDKILVLKKLLKSKTSSIKSTESNIYVVHLDKSIDTNLFYGAKNVGSGKIGKLIYIPELSKADDSLKMSGPSPLRELITFVFTRMAEKSSAFTNLDTAVQNFDKDIRTERSEEFSIDNLQNDINTEMEAWDVKFKFKIDSLKPQDIIKNLVSHAIQDSALDGSELNVDSFGQGMQRHLVYILFKLSAKYIGENEKKDRSKEFTPDSILLLFEEPEAFLHPHQQERMNYHLQALTESEDGRQQALITTHSPIFISKNINKLTSLIKIAKDQDSRIFQITEEKLGKLFDENMSLTKRLKEILNDPETPEQTKSSIKKRLQESEDSLDMQLQEESLKYFLWIDSERAALFFARHVIICEGATERILFNYLIEKGVFDALDRNIYILDAAGKFNIHRYMNLLGELGISHSVLMDVDPKIPYQAEINKYIDQRKNEFTKNIRLLNPNMEVFLDIPILNRSQKPLHAIYTYAKGDIAPNKLEELKVIFDDLTQIT